MFAGTAAMAQRQPSIKGFAEAGYQHESWVISRSSGNLYTSQAYSGNGYYLGGGVRSRLDSAHRIGYSIAVDFVQFNMSKTLSETQGAKTNYGFARLTPSFCYRFPTKGKFTFTGMASAAVVAALRDNERSYFQYGAKAAMGYKAYEAVLGLSFAQGKNAPTPDITGKWNEQVLSLGIICYPSLIKGYKLTVYKKH